MRRRVSMAIVLIGMLVLAACTVKPPPGPEPTDIPAVPDVLPRVADPLPLDEIAAFGAVATMNAGSNCTGTLIDTGVLTGPAYILTNGHCVGGIGSPAQQTTLGEEWWGTAEFFRAEGNLDATYTVDVVELAYSTMRHTDTAIVRLDATLGDLVAIGAAPVRIADAEPAPGAAVVNVGVPVQDLTDDEWVLRRGDCTLGAQHTVIEFFWLWFDAWSNDCPGIVQGSSGSPLFEVDADGAPVQVVGMINTTSWGVTAADGGACFLNRPCQVTPDGAEMVEETSYAQSVAGIGRCFDSTTGVFAAGGGCPLPLSDVWALQGGGPFRGGGLPDAAGRLPEVNLSGDAGTVRTALVPLGDGRPCLDESTYAGAESHELVTAEHDWDDATRLAVVLPEVEGRYALCAVRESAYERAATVLFEVDRTPPIFPAGAEIEDLGEAGFIVQPRLNPPELANVRFAWGSADEIDCDDVTLYESFFIVPLHIPAEDLPATYCIYGMDAAGNPTDVTAIDLPSP